MRTKFAICKASYDEWVESVHRMTLRKCPTETPVWECWFSSATCSRRQGGSCSTRLPIYSQNVWKCWHPRGHKYSPLYSLLYLSFGSILEYAMYWWHGIHDFPLGKVGLSWILLSLAFSVMSSICLCVYYGVWQRPLDWYLNKWVDSVFSINLYPTSPGRSMGFYPSINFFISSFRRVKLREA